LCEDHGMPQLFARPQTPNDNPFIESAFSTVKRAPEYPGRFLDAAQAREYFSRYFTWYDTEHYHSGIDYVTPQQAHDGLRPTILEHRRVKKLAQRNRRREENKKPAHQKQTIPNNDRLLRSVIIRLLRSLIQKRAALRTHPPASAQCCGATSRRIQTINRRDRRPSRVQFRRTFQHYV